MTCREALASGYGFGRTRTIRQRTPRRLGLMDQPVKTERTPSGKELYIDLPNYHKGNTIRQYLVKGA